MLWVNWGADDQNVGWPYSGIWFSPNKEGNSDTCYDTDESREHYAEWPKPVMKEHVVCDLIYMRCSSSWTRKQKVEVGGGGQGLREEGMGRQCLMGTEVRLGKMRKFWRHMVVKLAHQQECSYGHWTVHLQIVKLAIFMLGIFCYNKKIKIKKI